MGNRNRILSGMRPTGRLHVGHLEGVLRNFVSFQKEYECFFEIADWHALTTEYSNPAEIKENINQILIDWLSVGIDPEQSVIFVQSSIHEHAELALLLSFITPVPWLERCPTYKEQQQELKEKDINTYGFLGYPVLQAADILLYKATVVPVGEDQLPHIEFARELARRFNHLYGNVFPEPQPLLSKSASKLPGIDGRKMSKSYKNSIPLGSDTKQIETSIKRMYTDPLKVRADDKGHPNGCVVFAFHGVYNREEQSSIRGECEQGTISCSQCKLNLFGKVNAALSPINERRQKWKKKENELQDILETGARKAKKVASYTMAEVKNAMKLY